MLSNRIEVGYSTLLPQLVMLNKIVYYTNYPVFQHNGKAIVCSNFRFNQLDQLIEMLDVKFIGGEVFCFYTLSNINSSTSLFGPIWIIRGSFIEVDKDFILREVIDRDDQIEKILE